MGLPGILASQLFLFKPLIDIKLVDFPEKQSFTSFSRYQLATESADSACLHAFCDGAVNHSLVSDVTSQLTDPSYEKPPAINSVSPYIRNGKTALTSSEY